MDRNKYIIWKLFHIWKWMKNNIFYSKINFWEIEFKNSIQIDKYLVIFELYFQSWFFQKWFKQFILNFLLIFTFRIISYQNFIPIVPILSNRFTCTQKVFRFDLLEGKILKEKLYLSLFFNLFSRKNIYEKNLNLI